MRIPAPESNEPNSPKPRGTKDGTITSINMYGRRIENAVCLFAQIYEISQSHLKQQHPSLHNFYIVNYVFLNINNKYNI